MEKRKQKVVHSNQLPSKKASSYVVLIIVGLFFAGVLLYSFNYISSWQIVKKNNTAINIAQLSQVEAKFINNIRPIADKDHILGDLSAPIKIIEFSDLECPFCKRFHTTMLQIIDEYGKNGKVAWIFRHFPLDTINPKGRKEAEAAECAAELGGNFNFWEYVNRLFEITPSNNGLDLALPPEIAQYIGLGQEKFKQCLNSEKYARHIAEDIADGMNAKAQGTPYSLIITQYDKKFFIPGAQPYEWVKSVIDIILQKND